MVEYEGAPKIDGELWGHAYKEIVFDGTAGKGLLGSAVPIWTIKGQMVLFYVFGVVKTTLVSTGGTGTVQLEAYSATGPTTVALIGATSADALALGDIWVDDSPTEVLSAAIPAGLSYRAISAPLGTEVLRITPGTANITAGKLAMCAVYIPISPGARLV